MTNMMTDVDVIYSIIRAGAAYTTGASALNDAAGAGAMGSDIDIGTKYSITDAVVTIRWSKCILCRGERWRDAVSRWCWDGVFKHWR